MNRPVRGEVWLADCGLAAKVRPVAVISIPFQDSDRALITVIPHTTKIIGSAHEISIPVRWLEPGAFNLQAIFPLPPVRFIRKLGALNSQQFEQIEIALKRWEGLV